MSATILHVKNMVCRRCISTVEAILNKQGIAFQQVILGEIHTAGEVSSQQKADLKGQLEQVGFELIDHRTSAIIEKAKQLIMKKARGEEDDKDSKLNLSSYLSAGLNYEYTHLSSMFSAVEGRTIEQYYIEQRVEKVKELLVYRQLSLSEIAFEMNYSSVAHLSGQFKKITGLTPSYFKELGAARRKSLDEI